MPPESSDLITYYNVFEYAFPICLLTVAATSIYVGIALWRGNRPALLSSRFSTFLFGLFWLPTFLHSINHITDTIVNTPQNNALNWFGIIGIPLSFLYCWFRLPGQVVYGRGQADTKNALAKVLNEQQISFEQIGHKRFKTELGTFLVKAIIPGSISIVSIKSKDKSKLTEVFKALEDLLVNTPAKGNKNPVRVAACYLIIFGLIVGGFSFISWATSVFFIRPRTLKFWLW